MFMRTLCLLGVRSNGTSGLGRSLSSLLLGGLLWVGCLVPTETAVAQLQRERVQSETDGGFDFLGFNER